MKTSFGGWALVAALSIACGGEGGDDASDTGGTSDVATGGSPTGGAAATGGGPGTGGAATGGDAGLSGGAGTTGGAATGGAPTGGAPTGGAGTGGGVSANTVELYGRWDLTDPAAPTASWGAVYLHAGFSGTSVAIALEDSANDFQYRIDGGEFQRLSPTSATEHQLATGLPEGDHVLELYRRSGGSFGRTVFRGLVLDPGAEPRPAPARPTRRMEFVGDSITVGYGNEGTGSTSRSTENGYEAYGPQLARMLDAEWSVIAHSGQGLYRNLGEPLADIGGSDHMPDEFLLTFFPSGGVNPAWDHSRWQPDVLVVTLGTNDFSWPQWDEDPGPGWEPTEEAYVAAWQTFLSDARTLYPAAEIFAVGTFIATAENQFGRCNEYICSAAEGLGDAKVHCVDPGFTSATGAWLTSGDDYIGDWTHPTVAGHTKIASELRDVIQPIMGW